MFGILKCLRYVKCAKYTYCTKPANGMKFLNVAEKNDAAKTIAGLLSNGSAHRREGYSVYNKIYEFEAPVRGRNTKMVMTSVSGHLMQLGFLVSYRNWLNVDPRSLFDAPLRKSVVKDFEPIKRTLEREIRGCQGLIIWTDCDREGENIGYEIIDVCRAIKPNLTVYRATFSEITTTAIRRALQQLGEPDKRQSDAVDVRTELDLRTGAAITRFQTLRLQRMFPEKIADKLISYGSCQIPTLGFVAERYKEIEAFVSEAFWKIRVMHTIEDLTVEFNWARNRLFDKEACENYLLICLAEPEPRATVESVTVKPKHKWRPTPMDTVEMEKLGSRKLKLSAKETMTIAEKLYTKGLISYPRTETNQFSKEFALAPLVEQHTGHEAWGEFARRVLEWGPNPRNGNKSDQAHPPIHPTKMVTGLQGNEARVYELVVRHFLACVSKDAVGSETIVNIDIAGEKFSANGLVIHERNYLDVYVYDKWSAKQIHAYEQGQRFEPTEIMLHEGATTAPPLLTEADLIALMEKHGIGTDATHAEHINTIKERGYIGVVDKGALIPGVIGMGLYEGYDAMELALAKPLLRAEFEADLKRICLGEKDPKLVLREQIEKYKQAYQQIVDKITAMDAKISQRLNETPIAAASTNDHSSNSLIKEISPCPKCGIASLALKPRKNGGGFFINCLNFPDCKNVVWLPEECKEISVLPDCCPTCGEGHHMLKFRLSTPYYRGLFNTPSGWYKNCLRCDELFRSTFNINLDQVKRVGGIVGQGTGSGSGPGPGPGGGGGGGNGGSGSGGGGGPPRGGGPGGGGGARGGATADNSTWGTQKVPKPKATKAKTTKTNGDAAGAQKATKTKRNTMTQKADTVGTVRSYFTSTSQVEENLDSFFDSNDGFEEQMLAAAAMAETRTPTDPSAELDADIAAAFEADDDADFEALVSGSGAAPPPPSPPADKLDNSMMQWMREAYEAEETPMLWGREARAAADAQPSSKRIRLSDATAPSTPTRVLCTGCHQPAAQLIARGNGPNQGRAYYRCPKPNQCKFFQWAEDVPPAGAASSAKSGEGEDSWGTAAVVSRQNSKENNSWGSSNNRGTARATASQGQGNGSQDRSGGTSSWGTGGAASWGSDDNNFTWGSQGVAKKKPSETRDAGAWGSGKNSSSWSRQNTIRTADNSWGSSSEKPSTSSGTSWGSSSSNSLKSTTWGKSTTSNSGRTASGSAGTSMRSNSSSTVTITQKPKPQKGNDVKCNCGEPAISLTVRNNGPNHGRPFFKCANREKDCKFFQWDDTDEHQAGNSRGGSGGNGGGQPQGGSTTAAGSRTRRCGLCRGEGHTRNKCPKKADFDY